MKEYQKIIVLCFISDEGLFAATRPTLTVLHLQWVSAAVSWGSCFRVVIILEHLSTLKLFRLPRPLVQILPLSVLCANTFSDVYLTKLTSLPFGEKEDGLDTGSCKREPMPGIGLYKRGPSHSCLWVVK